MPRTRDYESAYDDSVSGIESAREPVHFAGSGKQDLAAGETKSFTLQPNMEMNPTTLKLDDAQADSLELVDAYIGPIALNAGDGPIPGSVFKSNGNFRFLSAVPILPNTPLRVRLRNKSGTPLTNVGFMVAGKVKRAS